MKKLIGVWLFLLVEAVGFAQPRILESLTFHSPILGRDVRYTIIVPQDYFVTTQRYPVVYLLHGLGDTESSWLEYGRVSQYVDAAVERKEIVPMIYVMPEGFRNYYVNDYAGKFLYQDMFVQEFVPFIDKQYRTIPDKHHRATVGYSMGGFGALILPLKHPEIFTVSVPLSISVRTDEQYKTEDPAGWDDQWGRLFGGVGQTDEARITPHYKQHSPFHIFQQPNIENLKELKLYIDNGDDEETLARSNEELHVLLRDINFPHQFRVRNGGHEFSYWRDALPNALNFVSDAVTGKKYRGDIKTVTKPAKVTRQANIISKEWYDVLLPTEYATTQRLYPVIYIQGDIDAQGRLQMINNLQQSIKDQMLSPVIVVFLKKQTGDFTRNVIPEIEKEYRVRTGHRFRALIGVGNDALPALKAALIPEQFTSCVLFDVPLQMEWLNNALREDKKSLSRTWLFIHTMDSSPHYRENSNAHILLRGENLYHEYRVHEQDRDPNWYLRHWNEALAFTERKIHR
ncbi:MAG TPA: hypothetical protein DHV26_11075 [Cytophagales bacterium]|jgi:enterochelin esterase-like enzyme|nr:hypothetical protein [Cytophagales bacterium]